MAIGKSAAVTPSAGQERRHVGVVVGVDPVVRQPVAGGVLAQRHRRRRVLGSNDLQRVRGSRHQCHPSCEERLEDDIAQPGVGQHLRAEHVGWHDDDLAGFDNPGREVRALPSDEVDLTQEPTGAMAR